MITDKKGEAAAVEIEHWAKQAAGSTDGDVQISVYYDDDSSTYVLRLAKENRVLLFRFSEAQVQTAEREDECRKILKRKIKDLSR